MTVRRIGEALHDRREEGGAVWREAKGDGGGREKGKGGGGGDASVRIRRKGAEAVKEVWRGR